MFRGSSFPTRGETTDGTTCVVKMRGAGNGAGGLLSEFLVNRLACRAGMRVPDVFVIQIQKGFPWEFGTDEFQDLVVKSPGANLGLCWIEGAQPMAESRHDGLPHEFVSQVVTLDLAFANWDRSVRSGNLLEDAHGRMWIVDHGSCRFLFQAQAEKTAERRLPTDHIFAGWEEAFDAHWLAPMTVEWIEEAAADVPPEWLEETRLTSAQIVERTRRAVGI